MEHLSVKTIARKLNTKTAVLITKLKLLGIEATSSSKLDEFTILKIYLLLLDNPRVEDVAETLHLKVGRVINKFETLGVSLLSKVSIVKEKDLINFLKSEDLYFLIQSSKKSIRKHAKKEVKKKEEIKQVRLFEVARRLKTSEKKLKSYLKEMHIFVQNSRTPLDNKTIKELEKKVSHSNSFSSIVSTKFQQIFRPVVRGFNYIVGSSIITGIVIAVCIIYITSFSYINYVKAVNYPDKKITGLQMPVYQPINKVTGKAGYLEIHKSNSKLPISLEGSYISELTPTLIQLKKSPALGEQGISILTDPVGNTFKAFEDLVPGDILALKTSENHLLYYKLTSYNISNVNSLPLKSALLIKIRRFDKMIKLKAILQKE